MRTVVVRQNAMVIPLLYWISTNTWCTIDLGYVQTLIVSCESDGMGECTGRGENAMQRGRECVRRAKMGGISEGKIYFPARERLRVKVIEAIFA